MSILDYLRRKKGFVLGRVVRRMRLKGFGFGRVRWHWEKVFMEKLRFEGSGMNNHAVITGGSGSGKSNACKLLLHSLSKIGASFVVFDPHGEYVPLANDLDAEAYSASVTRFDIFDLDGMSESEKISDLTETFRRIFRLGELQSYELYKCLGYLYRRFAKSAPSIGALLYVISIFRRNAKGSELNVLNGLEKRFRMLDDGTNAKGMEAGRLVGERSIIALSSLHSNEAQVVYMEGLLRKVYGMMLSGMIKKRFYVVIDEAEKLSNSRIVARLVEEGRKYGIGIVAVSQRAKSLDKSIISNSAMHIAFYQREPEELNYVANLIAGGNELERFAEVKKRIRSLRLGEAVVQFQYREPVVAKLNLCTIKDEHIGVRILELARDPVEKGEMAAKLSAYPAEKISSEISNLIMKGFLKYHTISGGVFEGTWYVAMPRNSAEHDIGVWLLGKSLSNHGIGNHVYNKAYGPDIMAYANGRRLAVEYETGKREIDDVVKMIDRRRENFGSVIVVVNDRHFDRYRRSLGNTATIKASEALDGGLIKVINGFSGKP